MYYVYLIKNGNDETYLGYTSDLRKRLDYHNKGISKYTRGSKWELVYYEAFKSKEDAVQREKNLKKSSNSKRWLKERIRNSLNS